jgi:hypothetical protein
MFSLTKSPADLGVFFVADGGETRLPYTPLFEDNMVVYLTI